MKIQGGNHPKGIVSVSGAKNSATRLLAATLLSTEKSTLKNFPTELIDAREKGKFLLNSKVKIIWDPKNDIVDIDPSYFIVKSNMDFNVPIRTTYLLTAGQLLRNKVARIPYPGGCKIGNRKYDIHVMIWKAFGCKVEEKENFIEVTKHNELLTPCQIDFPISTVGGTENAILCAVITQGITILKNAYVTPEILDLISLLRSMGASIHLKGNSFVKIDGGQKLRGINYTVMPDRIEALTWIIFGILSKGEILIKNVPFGNMEIPLIHLKEAGINILRNDKDAFVSTHSVDSNGIQPFELACGTHPGIISDMQPFYVMLALMANGRSKIFDYRYPNRTAYLDELNKFCNNAISYKAGEITINGPVNFNFAKAKSTDLRGSMAIILAGLLAKGGVSEIIDPEMALRGYNKLLNKLSALNIDID